MGSNIILATEFIESNKCSLCSNFLSVPPIMMISTDGEQQKCGRCKDVASELEVRNKFYEDTVQNCSFPCIYPKCTEKIQWGMVQDHEKRCPNRTIICPVAECQNDVEVSEYKLHCLTYHLKQVHSEKFVYNGLTSDFYGIQFLIKDELLFLIYINSNDNNVWVTVLSLYPFLAENWKYDVRLSSGRPVIRTPVRLSETGRLSLLYERQKVVGFDERKHCVRCIHRVCELKHHPFSNLYHTKPENIKTTVINMSKVINLFDTDSFLCTITLVDNGKLEHSN